MFGRGMRYLKVFRAPTIIIFLIIIIIIIIIIITLRFIY